MVVAPLIFPADRYIILLTNRIPEMLVMLVILSLNYLRGAQVLRWISGWLDQRVEA